MPKLKKIVGTSDYEYKGHLIGRYETERGGKRFLVEKGGVELHSDFTKLENTKNYIDVYCK